MSTFTLYLPDDLLAEVDQAALLLGISRSRMVREAVVAGLPAAFASAAPEPPNTPDKSS